MLTEIRKLYSKAKLDLSFEKDALRRIELLDQVGVIKNIDDKLTTESHEAGSMIELGQVMTIRDGSSLAADLLMGGYETGSIIFPEFCVTTSQEERDKILKSKISYLYFQEDEQKYKPGRLFKINTLITIGDDDWKFTCSYPKNRHYFHSIGRLSYINFSARPINYSLLKTYLAASKS